MRLPVGSKDLNQVLSQSQQGSRADRQSPSQLGDHSESNTHAHVRLQSYHIPGKESGHVEEEGQNTLTACHFSDHDGTIRPIGSTACPSATATATAPWKNSIQVEYRLQSSSVMLPDATSSLRIGSNADQEQDSRSKRDQKKTRVLPYVLFAIDGTWQEAKEIYKV